VREIIQIQDVKDTQILEDNIGYIRLIEFREDSHEEVRKALDTLTEQGADSLILDLRNNPGGLLNVALEITEQFLPEGQLIVSTKGRRASQTMETISRYSANKILDWPIVVLINAGSASGSEILAGALKDNKRAVTLGSKSFGKGSVQSVIPLPDGSGLRLTTSKYFTPSGESIHGEGITPDIVVERVYVEQDDIEKKEEEIEEIFDNVEIKDSEDPETQELDKKEKEARERLFKDNQVQSAISVIKGIKVFREFES
jgi:carboxyl-terminal processing protease